jgi:hypothetical protein
MNVVYYRPVRICTGVGNCNVLFKNCHVLQIYILCILSHTMLTETERRYSQDEKEALGVVWSCEKAAIGWKGFICVLDSDWDHRPDFFLGSRPVVGRDLPEISGRDLDRIEVPNTSFGKPF